DDYATRGAAPSKLRPRMAAREPRSPRDETSNFLQALAGGPLGDLLTKACNRNTRAYAAGGGTSSVSGARLRRQRGPGRIRPNGARMLVHPIAFASCLTQCW